MIMRMLVHLLVWPREEPYRLLESARSFACRARFACKIADVTRPPQEMVEISLKDSPADRLVPKTPSIPSRATMIASRRMTHAPIALNLTMWGTYLHHGKSRFTEQLLRMAMRVPEAEIITKSCAGDGNSSQSPLGMRTGHVRDGVSRACREQRMRMRDA